MVVVLLGIGHWCLVAYTLVCFNLSWICDLIVLWLLVSVLLRGVCVILICFVGV